MEKKKIAAVLVLAVLLVGIGQPAFAEQDTGRLIATKLFRGIANAGTGWMEIPKQIILTSQEEGTWKGISWGLVRGIGYAVGRSVVGGYEIATFPIPVPERFRPIMHPEYVLSDLPENPQPR